jgi:hypothetical protein
MREADAALALDPDCGAALYNRYARAHPRESCMRGSKV